MRKFYFYCFLVFLSSCTKINYIGSSYKSTNKVEVFVDEGAIRKKYDIMGKGYLSSGIPANPETIQLKAVQKAREKGADAILIKDYYHPVDNINTTVRTDTTNHGMVSVENTTMRRSSSQDFAVLFLKYAE